MTEEGLQMIAGAKVAWCAVYAYLYGRGGVSNKWIRRYLAPAWLVTGFMLAAFLRGEVYWLYLSCYPLYLGAASVGYGTSSTLMSWTKRKIATRAIVGGLFGVAAFPLVFANNPEFWLGIYDTNTWALWAMHLTLSIGTMTVLGVWNICRNSRDEESLVAAAHSIVPLFMA